MNLRKLPLLQQQAVVVLSVCVLVFGALIASLSWLANRSAMRQAEANLQRQVAGLADSVGDSFDAIQRSAKTRLALYRRMLPGEITLGAGTVPAGKLAAVPVLQAGATVLNGNMELLTKVKNTLDGDPAVMVRQGDQFIRIATFLKNEDGTPRFGSVLPADGPEVAMLKEGKTYVGLLIRDGKYYMSVFDPVKQDGKTIGAVSFRVAVAAELQQLNDRVNGIKVGQTGYAYVRQGAAGCTNDDPPDFTRADIERNQSSGSQ
jgi:hypothetical protein